MGKEVQKDERGPLKSARSVVYGQLVPPQMPDTQDLRRIFSQAWSVHSKKETGDYGYGGYGVDKASTKTPESMLLQEAAHRRGVLTPGEARRDGLAGVRKRVTTTRNAVTAARTASARST